MLHCGLLGKTLGHSYSPQIHRQLCDYQYDLFEKSEEELDTFLKHGEFDGLNVTIPYKKTVLPYCQEVSPAVQAIGSVNTIVRRPDGTLYGDNTDAFGFRYLVECSGIPVAGKKALVLGSGGASVTVCHVLRELGAREVLVISRGGEHNYDNLDRHADADLIVNTTPVGMYPNNGAAALQLDGFPNCRGVLDVVYNPSRTAICLDAEQRGIPNISGLRMLVAQAKRSAELFTDTKIPDAKIEEIYRTLSSDSANLILVGMPGSGKTTIGQKLAECMNRPFVDADDALVEAAGMDIPAYFAAYGEAGFRDLESKVLAELGKRSGWIISTGGGCVLREENYRSLHQNGKIFWIRRALDQLPRDGRPLSQNADLTAMYKARKPHYARFADVILDNDSDIMQAVRTIQEEFK